MIAREVQRQLVALAGRAPSPHNIQPSRWVFDGERIELWEAAGRWLSAGDPTGRDNRLAHGMAWEGMALALSRHGLQLALDALESNAYPPDRLPFRVARGTVSRGHGVDALASSLDTRASWRGAFPAATAEQLARLDACTAAHAPLAVAMPAPATPLVAQRFDAAAAQSLASPPFVQELYRWMRFSRRDPRWVRDGLAADCMALSPLEAFGASWLMRPRVVRLLSSLSLARLLVSESDKIRSAARIVAITRAPGEEAFDTGRSWYRYWLALDAAGFSAVPMSALSDSPAAAHALLQAWPLPPGRGLVNLMRVGPTPPRAPRSARLPAGELLLDG